MSFVNYFVFDIDWDIDEDNYEVLCELPEEVMVRVPPDERNIKQYISDYLRDVFEYCPCNFNYKTAEFLPKIY